MSASHMALVVSHSASKAVTRLVAMSLANNYDPEADYSVASIDLLCREANATPAQVARAFDQLVKLGEWSRLTINGTRVIRLVLRCPLECDRTAAHRTKSDFAALTPRRA